MKQDDIEEEKIGQENEDDLQSLSKENFSDAVLWGTDWTTETVISQLKKGNIELSPSFQRRDAWGVDRKSAFIESLILGLPIPQIILAERKDQRGAYIVIDGKQRLLSIRQYSVTEENDEFQSLKLGGLHVLNDLNGKSYKEISQQLDFEKYNNAFDNQSIRTVIIRNWPSQTFLYTVFLRLNTGSLPLSPQELRQALNPGYFTTFADTFSIESTQIKKVLNLKKPDYRMRDVEVVVRYFGFKNFIDKYTGNLKEFLDNTCALLNENWKIDNTSILEQAEELNNAIDHTYKIFGSNAFSKFGNNEFTGVFNRPVFDIMTYYFSNPEIRNASNGKERELADYFISLCKDDIEFLKSLEASTKNTTAVAKRFNVWGIGLKKILGINISIPEKGEIGIILK